MTLKHLGQISVCLIAVACISKAGATDTFYLVGNGPVSLALGGTGTASNIGTAGMMVNPATLNLLPEGNTFSAGLDVITADLKVRNTQTGETAKSHARGRNNGPYFAPELSWVWRSGRYAFGVGEFASAGVGTQFDKESFLSRTTTNDQDTGLGNYSRLLSMRIPVSFAFQATDRLSVGMSVDAVWTGINLGWLIDASQIGTLAGQGRLTGSLVPTLLSVPQLSGGYLNLNNGKIAGGEAESWGISGTLGLTYAATPATRLGVAYHFKTNVGDLTGDAGLTAVSAVAGNIPLSGRIRLRNFDLPAELALGISHRFNDQWVLNFDYKRVFWSDVLKNISVGFKQAGTGDTLNLLVPLNYRDTNVFGLGVEYRYNEKWSWRAGAHYAQRAMPKSGVLSIIPSTPTKNLTGGFSYAIGSASSIDVAVAYAFRDSVSNDSQPLTSVPIEARHGQTVGTVSWTTHF